MTNYDARYTVPLHNAYLTGLFALPGGPAAGRGGAGGAAPEKNGA